MKHISDQDSKLVVVLNNMWSRVLYIKRIGIMPALEHRCHFQRWTGARNLLCWCGSVKIASKGPSGATRMGTIGSG